MTVGISLLRYLPDQILDYGDKEAAASVKEKELT